MNESQSRFPPSVFLSEELDARGWSLEKLCLEADLSVGDLEDLQKNFDADESRQAGSSRSF